MNGNTWGSIYNKWLRKGADHGTARFYADRWEERKVARCPSTHCERRGECASPNECVVKEPTP